MLDCTSVESFVQCPENVRDLNRIVLSRIRGGPLSIQDVTQQFYLRCCNYSALERFDTSRAKYSTYIYAIVDNCQQQLWKDESKISGTEENFAATRCDMVDEQFDLDTRDRIAKFGEMCRGTAAEEIFNKKLRGQKIDYHHMKSLYAHTLYRRLRAQFLANERLSDLL